MGLQLQHHQCMLGCKMKPQYAVCMSGLLRGPHAAPFVPAVIMEDDVA